MLQILCWYLRRLKKSHMVPVLSRSREFSLFLDGTGTGTGKKWSRKKVPVPVPEKIIPGKKYRHRYRKNLVPEKSTVTGTGKNSGYRHTLPPAYSFCISGGQVARWPGGSWHGKWGIPEKSFQNVAQQRWPYLRWTPQSKVMAENRYYIVKKWDPFRAERTMFEKKSHQFVQ